jgi:predicted membrane channel-forming protein YqfA (hemolysin III family)
MLQIISDEDKRGRVMSFYAMGWQGMVPFGNLMSGTLASRIGAPNTLVVGGICLVVVSFLFGRKLPAIRKMIHAAGSAGQELP